MKKMSSVHAVRFVNLLVIAYLVFVILSDIMKWQQLDNTYMVLAICLIAATSEILRKNSDR